MTAGNWVAPPVEHTSGSTHMHAGVHMQNTGFEDQHGVRMNNMCERH